MCRLKNKNKQPSTCAMNYDYPTQGYSYNNYSNYSYYPQQQQQQPYQQHAGYYSSPSNNNYNNGWTAYPNSNQTHNYGHNPAPLPPQIIHVIRDESPLTEWEEEYQPKKIKHRQRDKSSPNERSSRSKQRIVPTGPPPPPKVRSSDNKSNKNSSDDYRPVYSPPLNQSKLAMTQYSDSEPPSTYAAYHQSSIAPDQSQNVTFVEQPSDLYESVSVNETTAPSETGRSTQSISTQRVGYSTFSANSQSVSFPVYGESTQALTARKYSSEVEKAIHNSLRPIQSDESEVIEIPELGVKGVWINRVETEKWRGGDIPISEYKINIDPKPEVIKLKYAGCVERVESQTIKFLKPPTPPPPGDLVITQLPDYQPPEAPPIIIRQLAPEHCDPKPLIIRERPPTPPEVIRSQRIDLPGKRIEPPPRRVIIEKLAKEPDQIRGVQVERWLPYDEQQRRIILNRAPEVKPIEIGHNIEYVWESPCVDKRTEFKNLGVEIADPVTYLEKYDGSLIQSNADLPEFALQAPVPGGVDLTRTSVTNVHRLVGDFEGLRLVDLDREGLSMYKKYIQ